MASKAVFIVAAKRTPFGAFGGKLKGMSATNLCAVAAKAALKEGNVPPEAVDSVVVGNVAQTSTDACYIARHVGLHAGVPISSPALTINRLCGSGFQSIINGAHEIKLGEAEVVMAGGTESMSQAPYAVRNTRFGTTLGVDLKMEDTLWASLTDTYAQLPMALTAEKLAEQYSVSRDDCDQFAMSSQNRWLEAHKDGRFAAELVSIPLKSRKSKEPEMCESDEHPRETSLEKLSNLKPVFKQDGTVTAGNASGICDGAGVVIVASEEAVKQHDLTPLARLVDYSVAGVDPTIMGIGPVYAIRNLMAKTGKSLKDIDLFEVNEAFAAQFLSVEKELGLERAKTNTNGGAIALGHPLAASGSRITAHLTHELRRTGLKYAVGSACIGGGQGIAVLLERV